MLLWLHRLTSAEKGPFILLYLIYAAMSYKQLGSSYVTNFFLAEDQLLETFSAIFLLISSILLMFTATKVRSTRQYKKYTIFFSLLSIAIFFWFAEEISWGQRILNFSIRFIEANNSQSEVSFHNLNLIQPHLHYTYFVVFASAALLCVLPIGKTTSSFKLFPNQNLFYYFFLPAIYYLIGQVMRDIKLEVGGLVFEGRYTLILQEAYEFLLALGMLRYSTEKLKEIATINSLAIKAKIPLKHLGITAKDS